MEPAALDSRGKLLSALPPTEAMAARAVATSAARTTTRTSAAVLQLPLPAGAVARARGTSTANEAAARDATTTAIRAVDIPVRRLALVPAPGMSASPINRFPFAQCIVV